MQETPRPGIQHVSYKEMFENITSVSLNKNISMQDMIYAEKQRHTEEIDKISGGAKGLFERTLVMHLPIDIHNQAGDSIPVECNLRSRTVQNLINKDILQNIRAGEDINLLDVDIELIVDGKEMSEYHHSAEVYYQDVKSNIIAFIQETPAIKRMVVDHYCKGIDTTLHRIGAKEDVIRQREKTSKDLFLAFGMPEDYTLTPYNKFTTDALVLGSIGGDRKRKLKGRRKKAFVALRKVGSALGGFDEGIRIKKYIEDMHKNNDEIDSIVSALERGEKEIQLDSKVFYLDNGDALYNDVIEKSLYNMIYTQELNLIADNPDEIFPYIRNHYMGLGCGNGKKDMAMISRYIDTRGSLKVWDPEELAKYTGPKIQGVVFTDSSLKSLSRAEKLLTEDRVDRGPSMGSTRVLFSQERIDGLIKNDGIRVLSSTMSHPHEKEFRMPDIRESSNMFTLFGGTFGNFLQYKQEFLSNMHEIMNPDDILCISVLHPPKNKEEQENMVRAYDTPEMHAFIKNFFIKLGIPKDTVDVQIFYDETKQTIEIDAQIHRKNNTPIIIHPTGRNVVVQDGTRFHCVSSQRMDESYMQGEMTKLQQTLNTTREQKRAKGEEVTETPPAGLSIKKTITAPGNPFTLYMITK